MGTSASTAVTKACTSFTSLWKVRYQFWREK